MLPGQLPAHQSVAVDERYQPHNHRYVEREEEHFRHRSIFRPRVGCKSINHGIEESIPEIDVLNLEDLWALFLALSVDFENPHTFLVPSAQRKSVSKQ